MDRSVFPDPDRAVLRVAGADAETLLQDLVTNNIEGLAPGRLVYAALLTPQGKYLFDFFIQAADGGFLIDIAKARAPAFAQRLAMYRLRRDAAIETTDLDVTLIWGGDASPEGALADPRDSGLGWRIYGPAPEATATRADYDALRVRLCAPETGRELIEDQTYILEAGFERLNGVDFRKGCYVGQEVTARMKHKTELKKGLARVTIDGAAEEGTALTVEGRPAGTLFTVAGGEGLAHLRFDRAAGEMDAGGATVRRAD